ncbi:MAG: hypothetical protein H6563_13355 [Lewinellaceae bacterium]|nr:hypothetical protein [Lewinellaceae bacterium]
MRTTTTTASWKRAMLHAWLGFILLLAFYMLTFGIPRAKSLPVNGSDMEQVSEDDDDSVVLTGLQE